MGGVMMLLSTKDMAIFVVIHVHGDGGSSAAIVVIESLRG